MSTKEVVVGGVAGSVVLGLFCPPAGLVLGAVTALAAGIVGVERATRPEEPTSTALQKRCVDTLPAGYEDIGRQIQQAVQQATRATAFEVAQQAASHYERASVEFADLGDCIVCSVYDKGGQLVEEVEIELPLR